MTISPIPHKTTLSNGLKIIYLQTQNDPISAAHIFLPIGSSHEEATKGGLTTLMWALLTKGTLNKSGRIMAEEIESTGSHLGAGSTHDYSQVSCNAISEFFIKTLGLMQEALFTPAFLPEEVEKEKVMLKAAIRAKKESIFNITSEHLNKQLYGEHPYSRPGSGTEESVDKLTVADLKAWHKKVVSPSNTLISIASDIPYEKIQPSLESLFGEKSWPSQTKGLETNPNKTSPLTKTELITNKSDFEQAYLMIGFPAPSVDSTDYIALKVLNGILGGGMSARLFQNLREKEGLAYDVGAFYPTRKHGSGLLIYMGLQMSRLEEAKARIFKELDILKMEQVPLEELNETVGYLKGTFILDHQTNSQRAHYLGWWEMLGLSSDFDKTYIEKLGSVSQKMIHELAIKTFKQHSITVETHPKKNGL